jgi:hypothetical protein
MAAIPYYSSYYGTNAGSPGMANSGYYAYPGGGYGLSPYGTSTYSSMYVSPGNGTTYAPQRRGLFGGMFRRRIAQPYYGTAAPSGYSTYGTAPSGYSTYGAAPYRYNYGTTGGYTYGAVPRGY